MNKKTLLFTLLIMVVLFSLLALRSKTNQPQTTTSEAQEVPLQQPIVPESVPQSDNAVTVNIVAEKGVVTPNSIDAVHLDTIELNVVSRDQGGSYRFLYLDFGLDETVGAGETKTVSFIAGGVGSHQIVCGESCYLTVNIRARMDEEDENTSEINETIY